MRNSTRHSLFALFAIPLLLSVACVKDPGFEEKEYPDYIVFGQDFAWCNEDACIEFFRLEPDLLVKSSSNVHPPHQQFYAAGFDIAKSRNKYLEIAEMFKDNIPPELFNYASGLYGTETEFGQYVYFEYKSGDFHGYWYFDQSSGSVPSELFEFLALINNAIFVANN